MSTIGKEIYDLADKIFPIGRSLTGEGVRETLRIINEELKEAKCPMLEIKQVPSNTVVFDWKVPREWKIRNGYIENEKHEKIIDYAANPLHIMGYSIPVDEWVDLDELKQYIYIQEDMPDAIPYVTSYYKERFGFCMTKEQRDSLPNGKYHMYIDSELFDGNLTYGELILKGKSDKEIFFSTYVCHPHMANNESSGPALSTYLIKYVNGLTDRRYTYRFIFIPETIGSITYISKNLDHMKKHIVAGYNLSCVGDNNNFSMVESRYANTQADRALSNVLDHNVVYTRYDYLNRGSDERQYNAPGVDIPVVGFSRSLYGRFPEYHTSKDDMSYVSPEGFSGSYDIMTQVIDLHEHNGKYRIKVLCEPQLGKRNLYPTVSKKGSYDGIRSLTNFIAYADGTNDLIDISNRIGVSVKELIEIKDKLSVHDLLENVDEQ